MRVLVACEYSGRVRDAFTRLGHFALSCDLLPTDSPGNHYEGDVRDVIGDGWDLMIAHPPCTYLTISGLHHNKRSPGRAKKTEEALDFIRFLWGAPIPKICIENPKGCINTRLPEMPEPQYIQPFQFGEDASKSTGLWLKNLPPLRPTGFAEPRIIVDDGDAHLQNDLFGGVSGTPRWSNQTDSGQNNLPPSEDRWKIRSETYLGIAEAMANQWG